MNICVLGCARSGTTAIYSLIQDILNRSGNHSVRYLYEPFLWNPQFFNGEYRSVIPHFNSMNSISFDGICNHMKLPLLIDDPEPYLKNAYLKKHMAVSTEESTVSKFIRANGRYRLLNRIAPDTRFVFIIRNPADNVNSIARIFSFYGGEYHNDDFPRFLEEINAHYNKNISVQDLELLVEKELLFWYYMNRFALESFENSDNPPLILCHEEKITNNAAVVQKLCRFLETPFKNEYASKADDHVGYVTKRFDISPKEYQYFSDYLDIYRQLLTDHHIDYSDFLPDNSKILDKFDVQSNKAPMQRTFYCTPPGKIIEKYKILEYQHSNTVKLLKEKAQALETGKVNLNNKELLLKKQTDTIREKDQLIKKKNEKIDSLEQTVEETKELLKKRARIIEQKDADLLKRSNALEIKKKELSEKDQSISQKQNAIQKKEERVKALIDSNKRRGEKLEELSRFIEEKRDAIKRKDDRINELTVSYKRRGAKLEEKDTIISQHEVAIKEINALLTQEKAAMQEKDRLLSETQAAINEMEHLISQHQSVIQEKEQLISQHQSVIQEKEQLISQHQSIIQEKEQLISQHQSTILTKEQLISKKRAAIKEKDLRIETLITSNKRRKSKLQEKDRRIEELEASIESNNLEIKKLRSSYSWKIGHGLIRLFSFLFGWLRPRS